MRIFYIKIILHILLILFIKNISNAQSVHVFDCDPSQYPLIKAHFYAFDRNYQRINNLSSLDFQVIEDGETRKVTHVQCPQVMPNATISLAISLDISTSMASAKGTMERPVDLGKATISDLVDAIESEVSEIALQACTDIAVILQDFTTDRQKIHNALSPLNADGGNNHIAVIAAS